MTDASSLPQPVALHVTERGQGFPVVLLHGFPFDHTLWDVQAEALSAICRVIAPDLRGHGQSPVTAGPYTMDLLAQDIFALLDQLNIMRAVWIGHSMGGYLSMAALRLAPQRIAGLGLVATHAHADSDDKRAARLATAERVLTEGSATAAQGMLASMFAPGYDLESPAAQAVLRVMSTTAPEAMAAAQRGMAARPNAIETLRGAHVPAVVVAGAQDQIVALDVARHMANALPQGQFLAIQHAGHLPMIEQPDMTTAALRALVERVKTVTGG